MNKQMLVIGIVAGLIGGLISHFFVKAPTIPTELRVRSISIIDEVGRRRIEMSVNSQTQAAALAFYDVDSPKARVLLGIPPDDTTELAFYDQVGQRIKLNAAPGGSVQFRLNRGGQGGIIIATEPAGKTAMVFVDKEGHRRAALGLNDYDETHMTAYDAANKVLWSAP